MLYDPTDKSIKIKLPVYVPVFNSVITSKFNIQWARDIVHIKFVLIKQYPKIKVLHLYLPCWGQSDFAVPPHHASSAHCPAPVVIVWSWQFLWHTYCSGQSKCTPLLPPLLMAVSAVLFDNLAKKNLKCANFQSNSLLVHKVLWFSEKAILYECTNYTYWQISIKVVLSVKIGYFVYLAV